MTAGEKKPKNLPWFQEQVENESLLHSYCPEFSHILAIEI